MTEQEKAFKAGVEAAYAKGVGIKDNPWTVKHEDPNKKRMEKALFKAWQDGYCAQMGVINWAKGLDI